MFSWSRSPANAARFAVAGLGAAAIVVLGARLTTSPSRAAPARMVVKMGASWAQGYNSLGALKAAADVVVVGVIGTSEVVVSHGIPYTDYQVSVEQVIASRRPAESPTTLTVHQTGGVLGNETFQMEDDPLFVRGERVVLFLHEYSPGQYFVLGGPEGRFSVQNDSVSAASSLHVPDFTGPERLTDFIQAVRNA